MKFGAQLKSKSVPEWRGYNLDYNELKFKIRMATENNNDTSLKQDLYNTLLEQIDLVNLFVNSKVGEIKRRIVYTENLLEKVDSNSYSDEQSHENHTSYDIESSLTNLSTDLQKLSRFLVVQKTALRKLLKKYTKYSQDGGELNIEINRFMIETPDSFIHLDLTGLFLELALIYDLIREKRSVNGGEASANGTPVRRRASLSNPTDELNLNETFDFESIKNGSISEDYLVHYDNLAELKLFLLSNFYYIDENLTAQRQRLQLTKQNSTLSLHQIINKQNSSESTKSQNNSDEDENESQRIPKDIHRSNSIYINDADKMTDNAHTTFMVLEDPKSFTSIKNNTDPGLLISNSKQANRSLLISAIGGLRKTSNALLKDDRFIEDLLTSCSSGESYESFYQRNTETINSLDSLENISIEWLYSKHIKPYLKVLCTKSRFTNTKKAARFDNNSKFWISLTSNVKISALDLNTPTWTSVNESSNDLLTVPYAHLKISYGSYSQISDPSESLSKLRSSHLIYRIGDSFNILTYFLFKSGKLSFKPSWANLFDENAQIDIRKLPPRVKKVKPSSSRSQLTDVSEVQSDGGYSTSRPNTSVSGESSQFRYWNEFDNGSEGEQDDGFLIAYDDQDDQFFSTSTIEKVYKLTSGISEFIESHVPLFSNKQHDQNEPLMKRGTLHHRYGGIDASHDCSDTDSMFNGQAESRFAHDKFLMFLALSTSILSLFLTAISLGITASLYSYEGVYVGPVVVAILLVSMLISLFFSILALCLLMMTEAENRSSWQSVFVWSVFVLVTFLMIGGIVEVSGI